MEREKTKMSNSPLVSYTKLSPNHSGKRNHVIDTITIHCMAGNASVETCGALFADPSRKASSNYGIGSDGRIALYVDEANRSWCSSSSSNDNRAITIEVANNGGAPDWPVSNKAYAALLDLVTDICKRNGIKKLVWSTNKNDRINHKNGCNMTIHRDFAAKACVPTNTEVLTSSGWRKLSDVKIGDEIACADLDNLRITFEEVYDKVEEKKQDTYTNNGLTATKDHRMIYSIQSNKNLYRVDQYKYLLRDGNIIYIPLAGYYHGDGLPLTNEMISFYVAVQADGHYMYDKKVNGTKSYYGVEFHLKKERKIHRIKRILEKIKLDYQVCIQSNGTTKIRIYNQDGTNIVEDICEKYLDNKNFNWKWLELSQEQADFFLNELLLWDGCEAASLYSSKDSINLDVVSAVAALNGVGSNITGSNIMFRSSPFCTLSKEKSGTVLNNRAGEKTTVSCVSVKTGFFLIRQNGKTFIVGNCPGDYLYNRHGQIAAEVNKRLEGEEEVDIAKLISEMTNEQAYQLMQKAELHAKTLDEPAWSKNEGHWAKATKAGIVDGSSPERPMKRDEVIAVLGRKNLI